MLTLKLKLCRHILAKVAKHSQNLRGFNFEAILCLFRPLKIPKIICVMQEYATNGTEQVLKLRLPRLVH